MSAKKRIILVIEQRCKAVPYPPEKREESENIGFQVLKGASEKVIAGIPEVQNCSSLRDALIAINAPTTRFFYGRLREVAQHRSRYVLEKGISRICIQ